MRYPAHYKTDLHVVRYQPGNGRLFVCVVETVLGSFSAKVGVICMVDRLLFVSS